MSTATFAEFAERADYSLLEALTPDPESTADGEDHRPRQVLSGHYVPVTPTAIPEAEYLAHSSELFKELLYDGNIAEASTAPLMDIGNLARAAANAPSRYSTVARNIRGRRRFCWVYISSPCDFAYPRTANATDR